MRRAGAPICTAPGSRANLVQKFQLETREPSVRLSKTLKASTRTPNCLHEIRFRLIFYSEGRVHAFIFYRAGPGIYICAAALWCSVLVRQIPYSRFFENLPIIASHFTIFSCLETSNAPSLFRKRLTAMMSSVFSCKTFPGESESSTAQLAALPHPLLSCPTSALSCEPPGLPEGEALLRGCSGHFGPDQLPRNGPDPRQALLPHQEVADAHRGAG